MISERAHNIIYIIYLSCVYRVVILYVTCEYREIFPSIIRPTTLRPDDWWITVGLGGGMTPIEHPRMTGRGTSHLHKTRTSYSDDITAR